jgi:hypothetical protein
MLGRSFKFNYFDTQRKIVNNETKENLAVKMTAVIFIKS